MSNKLAFAAIFIGVFVLTGFLLVTLIALATANVGVVEFLIVATVSGVVAFISARHGRNVKARRDTRE